ncbi:MAG: hypothetical protein OEN20_02565, partial [Gammaproteobacteria bacterium]|nr:hypothetical protein [Gammaproteobacteria bacterium]
TQRHWQTFERNSNRQEILRAVAACLCNATDAAPREAIERIHGITRLHPDAMAARHREQDTAFR